MADAAPDWQAEHKKLYGDSSRQLPPARSTKKPVLAGKFFLTEVSELAHDLILDLEQAYLRLYVAETPAEVKEAYDNLSARRRDLYQHIARFEALDQSVERVVKLRFD